jgi:pimeloyl-ACP methyl ester carboxylesterase
MKVLTLIFYVSLLILIVAVAVLYRPDRSRAELAAKYRVSADDYVTAAGMTLHVVQSGPKDAPAIVLLHGFGDSWLTFDGWVGSLATHYRVIRYDLPGFGLTGADPTGDYSDSRSIAVLKALLERLDVEHLTLIGNSMGGKLAWQFAAAYPALVDKLVLISPDGFASPGFEYEKPPEVPFTMRLLPYVLPKPLVRASLAPAFGDPTALSDELVTRYRDMMLAPGVRRAIVDRLRQVVVHDPEADLRRIKAPTLLLWGRRDNMIPFANAADYLRLIPNARLAELPDLGHVPQEEAPEISLKPVLAFLAE